MRGGGNGKHSESRMKTPPSSQLLGQLFETVAALERRGDAVGAETVYREILQHQPRNFFALHGLGVLASEAGRPDDAIGWLGRAIRINPQAAPAHCNLGLALDRLGQHERALQSFNRALALQPGLAEAHNGRGLVLGALGRMDEALASFDRAIAAAPSFADAHSNRGNTLEGLGRSDAAIVSHDRAVALNPEHAQVHFNRGVTLASLQRLAEAIASYDTAIALRHDFAEAHSNRAHALLALEQFEAALASCDAALAIDRRHAKALHNRGLALQELGRADEAVASLEQAQALNPALEFLAGDLMQNRLLACDWPDFARHREALLAAVRRGEKVTSPFTVLALTDDPDVQLHAARIYVAAKCPAVGTRPPVRLRLPGERLRIAYISADFRPHPVSDLMVEVFEQHDREHFEIIGLALGAPSDSAIRHRVAAAMDRFEDVGALSDTAIATMSREWGIDIAVDLGGHTSQSRPGIFARWAAPLQVSYVGYIGTMGAEYIDYLIADKATVPATDFPHFTERLVHLPLFQANPRQRAATAATPTRAEMGLPEDAFVFCCFNSSFKITPEQFDLWMRILHQVETGVLWLQAANAGVQVHLSAAAAARGIDPARLVFAPRADYAAYLARYRLADLFLDTHPYNAGATASDALWSGLPVLTRRGASFAGRMATSLLTSLGLPELIAETSADYEALALRLAADPAALAELRTRLSCGRPSARLYDVAAFTRSLEQGFAAMQARAEAGLPPEPITIDPA